MIIILASIMFSLYFVNITGIPQKIKSYLKYPPGKRLKPLDCSTCLSVWIAVLLFFLPKDCATFIAITFTSGIITDFLLTLRNK